MISELSERLFALLFFSSVFFMQSANAATFTNPTPEDLYNQSYTVLYGQVISKSRQDTTSYSYQIKVEQYFKNPQQSNFITALANNSSESTQFDAGDKAIFYIKKQASSLVVSNYSIKAGGFCDTHAFLGLEPIPGEQIIRGQPSPLTLSDENGLRIGIIQMNHPISVRYDLTNNYPASRNFTVEMSIQNENHTSIVLHKKQMIVLGACEYKDGGLNWNFVPSAAGYYGVNVTENGEFKAASDFQVMNSGTKTVVSPLQQFKSGITAKNVSCNPDLQLIFKAEGGSPACVKPETSKILVERGWAKPI